MGTRGFIGKPSQFHSVARILRQEQKTPKTSTEVAKKPSLWIRVKAEARHYWLGTKLLWTEIKIGTRLLWKVMKGIQLTRREHNQLIRTTKDVFRLIPFSIFVLVPFMELLLPVALKLFPDMLPSTYADKDKEEAKVKKMMSTKLNMAKFLRDSIAESGMNSKETSAAQEFASFFKKYRTTGERANTDEVLTICEKLSDDLTLDNLSRPQLVTLCRFMGINSFGTDNFLRFLIRNRLTQINSDDKMILREGIDSLTSHELMTACQARGIRTIGARPDRLRFELQQWLDLSSVHRIPSTLLILSRALMMTDRPFEEPMDPAEALQSTLTALPNEVVEEVELRISESEGKLSIEKKLDIIAKEEARIASELEQENKKKEESKKAEEKAAAEKEKKEKEEPKVHTFPSDEEVEEQKEALTKEQYKELSETLTNMTEQAIMDQNREQLAELKQDREKFLQESASAPTSKTKMKQLKELDDLIREVEEYLSVMDSSSSSSSSSSTAPSSADLRAPHNIAESFTADLQGNLTTEQLETALKMMRNPPDESRIKSIVKRLDKDGDGRVFMDEIMQLADEVGSEKKTSDKAKDEKSSQDSDSSSKEK